MAFGGFSYGGIDVRSAGVSPNGVLGRTNNTNAQAAERGQASPSSTGGSTGAGSDMHPGGMGVITVLLGIGGILFALYLARRNSEYLQRTTFGLNWYTTMVTGLLAIVFIVLAKIAVNKIPLGPVTTVINSV